MCILDTREINHIPSFTIFNMVSKLLLASSEICYLLGVCKSTMTTIYLVIMTAVMKSQVYVTSTAFTCNSKGSMTPRSKTSIAPEKPHTKCHSTGRCSVNLFT